jgi:hypothetical protein
MNLSTMLATWSARIILLDLMTRKMSVRRTVRDGRLVPPGECGPTFRAFERKLLGIFIQKGEEHSRKRGRNVIRENEMDGTKRKEIS